MIEKVSLIEKVCLIEKVRLIEKPGPAGCKDERKLKNGERPTAYTYTRPESRVTSVTMCRITIKGFDCSQAVLCKDGLS